MKNTQEKSGGSFFASVCKLAVPVALQSMLQASFSIIDQIMIGQLGSVSVAGVGLAGKFASIYSVMVSAIGAVAGIMISQYMGQSNRREVRRSFHLNLALALAMATLFTLVCALFPRALMSLYTTDGATLQSAASYLAILSATFLPLAGATLLSTLFRCMEKAALPLYASLAAAVLNTALNYILIFGKFGLPALGAEGAAIATVTAQLANVTIMLVLLKKNIFILRKEIHTEIERDSQFQISSDANTSSEFDAARESNAISGGAISDTLSAFNWKQYAAMLLPILVCEFMWSLGENVYAAIYGRMGTESAAAMTLINPVQGLMIGALCGLSSAAAVLIGKKLGEREYSEAYAASKKLLVYGFVGSALLSLVILATAPFYVRIYQVEEEVRLLTRQILVAYSLVAPFKVLNMILGGAIIRSGGKTKYVMGIDLIGTWGIGVPLGLVSAFVLRLSVPWVYFILSLEECARFVISLVVFRRKNWMQSLSPSGKA